MNWVKKYKLPAIKAIYFNKQPCIKIKDLWQVLYQIFNSISNKQINSDFLDELPSKPIITWPPFSKKKFRAAIDKCNSLFTLELDHISCKHLKAVVKDDKCLSNIVNIVNVCINLGHWPTHFKILSSIIIPKPNKVAYNSPKTFRPIVLLNTLRKLIEKVISERLQFQSISKDFIHLN